MHYLVWGAPKCPEDLPEVEPLASGDMLVLEGPWPLGATALGYIKSDAAIAALARQAMQTSGAFAVEGFDPPSTGRAFVIAAHKMLDAESFRPYADAIPAMLKSFGVRSLARGGRVTPLAGGFVPDRGVVLEFPSVESVLDFYGSETYAPLLALRLRTTDPRFVILSRDRTITDRDRRRAEQLIAR